MGIYNLLPLIKKISPNSLRNEPLSYMKNKTIAIDASVIYYQFLTQLTRIKDNHFYQLKDKDGNLTAHLLGIFNRSAFLLSHNIEPIWVFDGAPPESKS